MVERINFLAVSALLISMLVGSVGWFLIQLNEMDDKLLTALVSHKGTISSMEKDLEHMKADVENINNRLNHLVNVTIRQLPAPDNR